MTYKLNPEVKKIASPILLLIDGESKEYPNGAALSELTFEKDYLISTLAAKDGVIVMTLEENTQINDTAWANGKTVSFFD